MAKLGINTGSTADDGTGDSLRVGGGKINHNFNEVYSLLTGAGNNGNTLLSGIVTSITAGSNITLSGGPTGAIAISAAALTGTGFFTSNSTGIHTLGSVGIGTTTAENNGLSVPLGNVFVGKGVTTLNLNVSGVTTFSGGDINIKGDGSVDTTGVLWDASVATLEFDDHSKISFGEGSDLTLYHDENNSWIKDQATGNLLIDSNGAAVKITKAGAAETMAEFNTDGPVKLFHNNVRVLETVSTGATVVGDLYVGGDLFVLDDVVYDEVTGRNLNITGVGTFNDDAPLYFGDSQDLKIFHDATSGINDGRIVDNTGHLKLETSTNKNVVIRTGVTTQTNLKAVATEGVELYFNGNKKFETDKHGAIVTGIATATGFSGPLTGTATGLSGSPSIEVTNIVGAAASIAGIVTATSFVKSGGTSSQYLMANGTVTTGISDLGINATQRLLIQVSNGDTDILAAGNSGEYLKSAGSGSAPTWSSDLSTAKIRAASYALGGVFAHTIHPTRITGAGVVSFYTKGGS